MMQIGVVGMGRNGFMNYVMQSQETTDKLIEDFEKAFAAGHNPSDELIKQIFANRGVKESDLSDFDKKRLKRKVEEVYKTYYAGRRY